jgi:hypothetical protein
MQNENSNEATRYQLLERADPDGMDVIGEYPTFEEGLRDVMHSLYSSLVYKEQ